MVAFPQDIEKVLRGDPRSRGARKLFDDIYRIRVGDYRVIYRVDDAKRLVDIGKVERRRERTYRDIGKLFD